MNSHNRLILLGFGSVGQCALPLLLDRLRLPASRCTVIDGDPHEGRIEPHRRAGVTYEIHRLAADNLCQVLEPIARRGDLLVNLSVGVDSIALADWCHQHGVLYVDTALEPWEEFVWQRLESVADRTEYAYHQRARRQAEERWQSDGATAVVTHGANPGLVNHFVKAALLDVAEAMNLAIDEPNDRIGWAKLARATGTRVIHIAERDTQRSREPKRPDEFVNTWSIPGFVEEASMPVEIGWGTHEKTLPDGARRHARGPGNAIYIPRPGMGLALRSWVPLGGQIAGLALPHNEAITLSDYLTVFEDDAVVYRPTVVFAYLPCDAALASLHETMMCDWRLQTTQRVMTEDIVDGGDELGVLLLGHELGGWWYGSQLDINQTRSLAQSTNPTALQVAAGVVSAARWCVDNPARGYCEPEALPHREILDIARPYLGSMVSQATDWTPLKHRRVLFENTTLDYDDPCQFANFIVG